jgi:CBS-domain-containing membrane protein
MFKSTIAWLERQKWYTLEPLPAGMAKSEMIWSSLGVAFSLTLLSVVAQMLHMPLLIAPFAATVTLVYAVPQSPLSQPRSVLLGYALSMLVGFALLALLGNTLLAQILAVSLATLLTLLARAIHPPASALTLAILWTAPAFAPLFFSVFLGLAILVLSFLMANNRVPERRYPRFWW